VYPFEILIEDDEKYIEIVDIPYGTVEEYKKMWEETRPGHAGYEADFVFHSPVPPPAIEFFAQYGITDVVDEIFYHADPQSFRPVPHNDAKRLTESDFPRFAAIHDAAHPEMYWTSARLLKDLSPWRIYTIGDDYILARSYTDVDLDIYCLHCADIETGKRLLSAAGSQASTDGNPGIMFMVETRNENDILIAKDLGFTVSGECHEYHTTIR